MDEQNLEATVARLDAQLPLMRMEISKLHVKADKIDADQRKMMILFEETEAKFKITLEGYIAVGKILDKVEGCMDALEQKIAMLPTKNEMEGWFARIIEILDKKVDREEFDAFKRRLLPIN